MFEMLFGPLLQAQRDERLLIMEREEARLALTLPHMSGLPPELLGRVLAVATEQMSLPPAALLAIRFTCRHGFSAASHPCCCETSRLQSRSCRTPCGIGAIEAGLVLTIGSKIGVQETPKASCIDELRCPDASRDWYTAHSEFVNRLAVPSMRDRDLGSIAGLRRLQVCTAP